MLARPRERKRGSVGRGFDFLGWRHGRSDLHLPVRRSRPGKVRKLTRRDVIERLPPCCAGGSGATTSGSVVTDLQLRRSVVWLRKRRLGLHAHLGEALSPWLDEGRHRVSARPQLPLSVTDSGEPGSRQALQRHEHMESRAVRVARPRRAGRRNPSFERRGRSGPTLHVRRDLGGGLVAFVIDAYARRIVGGCRTRFAPTWRSTARAGPVRAVVDPHDADPPRRVAISVHSLHRTPGRGRHRAVGRGWRFV